MSYGKATPYFPVIDLLKRYVHIEDTDEPRTIRAKVTGQLLTLDETFQDTIPALLALLDALQDDNAFLTLDPPQRRQRTLAALKRVLLRESQVQPVLLVFEDLHWIDAETQALLDSLVESLPTARLLCWSTTARSISMAGAARPTTPSSGSIRCPRRAPTNCCTHSWGTIPVWPRSSSS